MLCVCVAILLGPGSTRFAQPLQQFKALDLTMSERKAVIKNADMSEDMQTDAIDCAAQVWTAERSAMPGTFERSVLLSQYGATTLLSVLQCWRFVAGTGAIQH